MTSSQLSDQSMYSRGQVLTRDFNTLRSLIVHSLIHEYQQHYSSTLVPVTVVYIGAFLRAALAVSLHAPPKSTFKKNNNKCRKFHVDHLASPTRRKSTRGTRRRGADGSTFVKA